MSYTLNFLEAMWTSWLSLDSRKTVHKLQWLHTLLNEKFTRTRVLHWFFSKTEQIHYSRKEKLVPWCLSVGYMFVDIRIPRPSKRGTDLANSSVRLSEWRVWLKNLITCSHRTVFTKVTCDAVLWIIQAKAKAGLEVLLECCTGFILVL